MIRIRKVILLLTLLQAWAILFALLIEKTIDLLSEMRDLSDIETIVVLSGVWIGIGLIIFMFYNDLAFLKSLEGLLDRILPNEKVNEFSQTWKKVTKNKSLDDHDLEILREFEEMGYLYKGFTSQHVQKRWSRMEAIRVQFQGIVILVLFVCLSDRITKYPPKTKSNELNSDK